MMIAKITFVVLVAIFLNGCYTTAALNNINGQYYIGGDPECVRYTIENTGFINCFTRDEKFTEVRRAMSDQELQVYLHNQQMEQQNWDSLMNNLRIINLQQQIYYPYY